MVVDSSIVGGWTWHYRDSGGLRSPLVRPAAARSASARSAIDQVVIGEMAGAHSDGQAAFMEQEANPSGGSVDGRG